MDDDGLNMRNWGYYEPSFKEHIGLQLMSPFGDNNRDTKPFLSGRESPIMINPNGGGGGGAAATTAAAAYHHHYPPMPTHYVRDSWAHRERLLHMLPGNPTFVPDNSGSNSVHIMQPVDSKDHGMSVEDIGSGGDGEGEAGGSRPVKKRSAGSTGPKTPRGKKPKKTKEPTNQTGQRSKVMKRNLDVVINGIDMDISGIPIPICSCTGTPQQCYRWGSGGWQSACCTTTISMYPLPMSTKRRGARIAGRKMSQGAFKKVLEKLASEGYSFDSAIDLRGHWAKHGTNKFVTIR